MRLKIPYLNLLIISSLLLGAALTLAPTASVQAFTTDSHVFINEIHYDNSGTDTNEFIEIAGTAGTDLTGWTLVLYNGSNGEVYDTTSLSGTIPDQRNGYGAVVVTYPSNGLQNGSPDGLALVNQSSEVVQFLSYEGSFSATNGPAIGLTSTDIMVSEPFDTPIGFSVQLSGTGDSYDDFTWISPFQSSPGSINLHQIFGITVFINEFHYDSHGVDDSEFIEIAGPAGLDLTGWQVVLYAGDTGLVYATFNLSGTIADQMGGYGVISLSLPRNTMSNDSAGIALVNADGKALQLVSYEGSFTANDGPAAGMTSHDVGVEESNNTSADESLQLYGTGSLYEDFTWAPYATNTKGAINTNQVFFASLDYPPYVVSVTPADHTFDVALDTNLVVTFSEPVTTQPGWLQLICSTSGELVLEITSPDNITFSADPSVELAPGELCTATVVADLVSDQDGKLETAYSDTTWQFSTTGMRIHNIQGASHISPFNGWQVANVPGIVTVVTSNSYYLQDPSPDENPATSEGILVYTGSTPTVAVGDAITLNGTISEYRPGGSSSTGLTTTEITYSSATILSSDNELPAVTSIGSEGVMPPTEVIDNDSVSNVETDNTFDPSEDGIDFYESLEGMLVSVHQAVAVSGTNVYGEIAIVSEPHAGLFSSRGALVIQQDDFNPERIILDDTLIGLGNMPLVSVGDPIEAPLGVMDYSFGNYKLLVTEIPAVTAQDFSAETASEPDGLHLRVASMNVENLSALDDPTRFSLLADQIVNNLQSPDILGLQEIQDDNGETDDGTVSADLTLTALITAITDAGGPIYEYRQINPLDNTDGGAPGANIRVGFLFQPDRVSFADRAGGDAETPVTVQTDLDGKPYLSVSPGRISPLDTAFDDSRKPLVGEFVYKNETVFVVVNHFNSKGGDQPLFGRWQPPVLYSETQRLAQAALVNQFVSDLLTVNDQANVVVMGDLNDFYFSSPLATLTTGGDTTVELVNLHSLLPENERYTYIYDGNAQTLDHILVSPALAAAETPAFDIVHLNAERPVGDAQRSSDHEPLVADLNLNTAPTASDTSGEGLEDHDIVVTLPASDGNDDALNFSVVDEPANGSYSIAGDQLSYTPDSNFNGSDFLTFAANDGLADSNTARVDFTVTAVNDPPTFTPGSDIVIDEDAAAQTFTNWATNISAGPADEEVLQTELTFYLSADDESLFDVLPAVDSTGTLTFTPKANAYGTTSVDIWLQDNGGTVNDGVDTSPVQTFEITLTGINDTPVGVDDNDPDTYWVYENETLTIDAPGVLGNDNDVDDDSLFAVLSLGPVHGSLELNEDGSFSYTPDTDYVGLDSFRYYPNDGTTNGNETTVTITVLPGIPVTSQSFIFLPMIQR